MLENVRGGTQANSLPMQQFGRFSLSPSLNDRTNQPLPARQHRSINCHIYPPPQKNFKATNCPEKTARSD